MREFSINPKDELDMKLLHYFITEEGYTPIVLHGAKDEIWLENMQKGYKVVRIVSGYIRNKEQYEFDAYKTQSIVKSIKKKTFSLKVKVLSIFVNLEDDVHLEPIDNIDAINIKEEKDLNKFEVIKESFPLIGKKLKTTEKGVELFSRITAEINENSKKAAQKVDDIFLPKRPYITYGLIAINTIVMIITYLLGTDANNNYILHLYFGNIPQYISSGEYYRLLTSIFLHGDLFHFLFNNYALYIIGSQIEGFFGKPKYLLIYLFSGITGSLLSISFMNSNSLSIGASGAIFGLLGAVLYFGYFYRVYLGNVLKSQIIPLILFNLVLGFLTPGIDNFAHIGGLIGGVVAAMALGIKYKEDKLNEINGYIIGLLYTGFLIYLAFIY